MSSLSDILKNNVDTSCILLHGDVTDCVISKDLCFRDFFVALADILREHGFDNVVFYDSTNALGKYVLDDQSAYYSIQGSEKPYLKKYGQPPKGGTAPQPASTAAPQQKSGEVITFGKPRKKVSCASEPPQVTTTQGDDTEIIYQQKNMLESVFYGECQSFMNNDTYRSAVVFTDINNFLQNEGARTRYAQVIHNAWRKNNLLIFIHPDLSVEEDRNFFALLRQSGILEQFYKTEGGGCSESCIPKEGRVFRISTFDRDEILYLLKYHQMFNGLTFSEGINTAVDKISYIVNTINGDNKNGKNFSLRGLNAKMESLIKNSFETEFNDDFIEKLLDCNISGFDFEPWETLKRRPGWESVVKKLDDLLEVDKHCKDKKVSYPYRNKGTLMVRRIDASEDKTYPTSNKLPHMMFEGNPGTGKTTAINQIGRLMKDCGLLSVGHVVKAFRGDLIGDVIGGTAIKTQRLLDKAENGVLFIDEAYDLCKDYGDGSNASTFALEAVNTLVNAMTDESRHVLVIFSGYKSTTEDSADGVGGLYRMNRGLKDRIKATITIPDYKPEVLTKIFFDVIDSYGYSLDDDLSEESIKTYMNNVYQTRNRREFSNGRFVKEVLIEKQLIKNAQKRGDFHTITRADFGKDAYKLEEITLDSIKKELDEYPGLGQVAWDIIEEYMAFRNMQIEDGVDLDDIKNLKHIVFKGNPGTGKTTIAGLLCKAMGVANIMSGAEPIIVSNPETITPTELSEKVKDAVNYNTFLFIDEAHNASEEIIHSLLNPMSENKKLTCVFAVYDEKYEGFLEKDNGLLSRIKKPYSIEDYTSEQLLEIFKHMAEKDKRKCSDDC